jgi:hypothetical protein
MNYAQLGYAPFASARPAYPLATYRPPYAIGADATAPAPATTPSLMDKLSTWGNQTAIDSIPNKYAAGAALLVAGVWILHAKKVL